MYLKYLYSEVGVLEVLVLVLVLVGVLVVVGLLGDRCTWR